ncbi:MAG: hypothetical protein M1820_007865 [Bogoriella megaspora]|nr:MAG: hypothetical protein M1820_007865 [Bogoriella megaspora]
MPYPNVYFGAATLGLGFDDVEEVSKLLEVLEKHGIKRIDTAGRYPPIKPGVSESLLGQSKASEKGFVIDTKILAGPGDGSGELENAAISESLSNSLQRLGVSALGVSNFSAELLQEYLRVCSANNFIKPTVYQGDYNAVTRGMEKNLLSVLRANGIKYNAFRQPPYRPLCSGFLTGKFTAGEHSNTRFGDEHPLGKAMQGVYGTEELHSAVTTLSAAAEKFGVPLHQAALRWLYHHSALNESDGMILGATKVQQLEENIETLSRGPLPMDFVKTFDEVWLDLEPKRGTIV